MAEWKEIYLSEDYVVSNEGEVARVKDGLVLKQYPQKSGYVNVWLRLPWGNKSFPVHRLVCIAFHGIEGYKQGLFVDHIDTNRALKAAHKGTRVFPYAQPYRDPFNPSRPIPQWQKYMANWVNKKMLFEKIAFEDFEPRKGFKCKEYFK